MRFRFIVVLMLSLSATFHSSAVEAARPSEFSVFSDVLLPGRLFIPPEAADLTTPRPLILFLHGAGETGTNNRSQVNSNINNLLLAARDEGAFLYAPQATSFSWSNPNRTTNVMAMIDRALDEQNIDPDRLYVTGLSMGGGGVWDMLNRFPDRFSAGVPIAGVGPGSDFDPLNLVGKPVWPFHARDDPTVHVNSSRFIIDSILAAAGEEPIAYPSLSDFRTRLVYSNDAIQLNYTELANGRHGIWERVYTQSEMYDWMFSKTTAVPEPSTAMLLALATVALGASRRRLDATCRM